MAGAAGSDGVAGAAGSSGSGLPPVSPDRCGDGQLAASEGCDDGNTGDGDGCSSSCSVEAGYSCPPSGRCEPSRGDAACTASACRLGALCLELVALPAPGVERAGFSCACPAEPLPECPSAPRAVMLPLPDDMSRCSGAALSGDGTTVVGWCESFAPSDGTRWSDGAFKWTIAGGVERLPDGEHARATGVNADGSVSVGGEPGQGAMIWRAGSVERFADGLGSASGVSADGAIVVGGDVTGWVWASAELLALPPATEGLETAATAISADGTRIVGYEIDPDLEINPLVWSVAGEVSLIPLPPDTHAIPFGVSADGSVVLTREFGTYDGCCRAGYFRWPSDGVTRLDYEGMPLAMSADGGTILGSSGFGMSVLDLGADETYTPLLAPDPGGPLMDIDPVAISSDGSVVLANARLLRPRDERTRPIVVWRP